MTERTYTLDEIKAVLTNQLAAEKQMGADDRDYELIKNIFADVEYLLQGGWIVGGARIGLLSGKEVI
jgi:hypothetical protein